MVILHRPCLSVLLKPYFKSYGLLESFRWLMGVPYSSYLTGNWSLLIVEDKCKIVYKVYLYFSVVCCHQIHACLGFFLVLSFFVLFHFVCVLIFSLCYYPTKTFRNKGKTLPCSHFQIIRGFDAAFRLLVLPF